MDFHFLSEFTSKILEDDTGTNADGRQKKNKTTIYKCQYCTKQFTEEKLLAAHEKTHDPDKPYQCTKCDFSCKRQQYLARHYRVVHGGPGHHQCEHCHKRFLFPHKLRNHMFTHTGEKPYACDVCDKSFNSTYSLKTHMYIHTNEKPYACDVCNYACRDSSTLRKHKEYHKPSRTSYSCTLCDASYRVKHLLKSHIAEIHFKLDVRKHKCEKCDMAFKAKAALVNHIRSVHEQVSPSFPCPACHQHYSSASNLKEHLKRHSGQRMFVCQFRGCHKTYVDSSGLKKHLSQHHGGQASIKKVKNKEKEVECDYCGMRFDGKNILIRHMKKFHNRGKNKYKCRVCDYQNNDKTRFRVHLHRVHDMTIFYCDLCDQKFRKLRTYNDHNEVMHRNDNMIRSHLELEVQVKQEPINLEDMEMASVDLFDLENHQVLGDLLRQTTLDSENSQTDEPTNTLKQEVILEEDLNQYCQKGVMNANKLSRKKKSRFSANIDAKAEEKANKYIKKVTADSKRQEKIKELETVRREYNKRIMGMADQTENIKIKYYKCNDHIGTSKENSSSRIKEMCDETETRDGNVTDDERPTATSVYDESKTIIETKIDEENEPKNDVDEEQGDEIDSDVDYEDEGVKKTKSKLKLNTHQCYICFKLYPTKAELLEHCKEHFNISHSKPIKKCPLCKFSTKFNLRRHLQIMHDIDLEIPYRSLKNSNDDTNKFYYEVKSNNTENIKKIEIIPSVGNMNKIAYVKIDAKNRKSNNTTIHKTKLVRKGKEWVVEKEKVHIKYQEYLMPEINFKEITTEDLDTTTMTKNAIYMTYLRKLYHIAKKRGKKILFPCSDCEKICQNLAALNLHLRKHDKNAKPYKAKVYKDKALIKVRGNKNKVEVNKITSKNKVKRNKKRINQVRIDSENKEYKMKLDNRNAVPEAIKNKHKCDKKLMDFYTNNIRGKNIEFWQFLKIFNKMDREKIKDFQDLEKREDLESYFDKIKKYDEDLELANNTEFNDNSSTKNDKTDFNETVVNKTITTKNNSRKTQSNFKRVIRISKADHMKRNAIKNKLREAIVKQSN